jgi:hypothetical protein
MEFGAVKLGVVHQMYPDLAGKKSPAHLTRITGPSNALAEFYV